MNADVGLCPGRRMAQIDASDPTSRRVGWCCPVGAGSTGPITRQPPQRPFASGAAHAAPVARRGRFAVRCFAIESQQQEWNAAPNPVPPRDRGCGGTASGFASLPVLYRQAGHPGELTRIVRDNCRSVNECYGGDHEVVAADLEATAFQIRPDLAICLRRRVVEVVGWERGKTDSTRATLRAGSLLLYAPVSSSPRTTEHVTIDVRLASSFCERRLVKFDRRCTIHAFESSRNIN